eukprot:1400450-Amphidinium_carterae.1
MPIHIHSSRNRLDASPILATNKLHQQANLCLKHDFTVVVNTLASDCQPPHSEYHSWLRKVEPFSLSTAQATQLSDISHNSCRPATQGNVCTNIAMR